MDALFLAAQRVGAAKEGVNQTPCFLVIPGPSNTRNPEPMNTDMAQQSPCAAIFASKRRAQGFRLGLMGRRGMPPTNTI
jgi:hypothetical protein